MHQARNGSDQSDQGRNTDDHFEHDQSSLQSNHFVTGPRLNGFDIFRARPAQMRQSHSHNARERRGIVLHNPEQTFRISAGRQTFHFALDRKRQNIFFPQGKGPQNNDC